MEQFEGICLVAALICLAAGLTLVLRRRRAAQNHRKGGINWVHIMVIAVLAAGVIYYLPVAYQTYRDTGWWPVKTLLVSLFDGVRLFFLDTDFWEIQEMLSLQNTLVQNLYAILGMMLLTVAPLLTVGVVISLFSSLFNGIRLQLHRDRDRYIFSELADDSLALAKSLREHHPEAVLIFTDVGEEKNELQTQARQLNAILLNEDLVDVDFFRYAGKGRISFFLTGEDHLECLRAVRLVERYQNAFGDKVREERKQTTSATNTEEGNKAQLDSKVWLYLFSDSRESEMLLSTLPDDNNMNIRRINPPREFVYRLLYEQGTELFETAVTRPNGDGKDINLLVVGLGGYGMMFLRSVVWYCQMTGYRLHVFACDANPHAETVLRNHCPELLDPHLNGQEISGEPYYDIRIQSGVDVNSNVFSRELSKLRNITYAFVALGNDQFNLDIALMLRRQLEGMGQYPVIKCLFYDAELKSALQGMKVFSGQPLDIDMIGTLDEVYSEQSLVGSELEDFALKQHLRWDKEEKFWRFEYNYRSSVASAIHKRARYQVLLHRVLRPGEETPELMEHIARLEHCRWNAYMRSYGYRYSGSPDNVTRNDRAMLHHNLIPYDQLDEPTKKKDYDQITGPVPGVDA